MDLTTTSDPVGISEIVCYAEPLPGGRGQMRCDVVFHGRLVDSFPVGSPAPFATVKRHESRVRLGRAPHGDA